jgi:4-diphosphocytidyl-2-C-methyl-D-erythritol kinase
LSLAAAAAGVAEAAPAKINLALHVTGRRADGYHTLDTLVAFTRIGDRVTVERSAEDSFTVSGPFAAQVPPSSDNLVLRARDGFRDRFGWSAPLEITLEKNLPAASGIGGGSSDAAAALRALLRLARPRGASSDDLRALALALGADVPMCLDPRPARAGGIGELLEPCGALPPLDLVLANPGVPVSTPLVFAALERRANPPLPPLPGDGFGLPAFLDWLHLARNDLEAPALALAPAVGDALAALRQGGARLTRMSGSGATCFGVFPDSRSACGAAEALRAAHPLWWVEATRTTH